MPKLKTMPPLLGSADELMAMSHALEKEAASRYRDLAARMRLRQEQKLAGLFEFLASIEEKHAAHVAARALEAMGKPVDPARISWEMPENFDEEEGSSRVLTPYRALAIAVRNEERAFAFYSYVAAEAREELMRKLAEELAKDELEHAFLLRRERRKAYREKDRPEASQLPASAEELYALGAETEWQAAAYHRALDEILSIRDEETSNFGVVASDEASCARDLASRIGLQLKESSRPDDPEIEQGMRLLEEVFDRYADIAERSKDEKVVQAAQMLAERAVRRLSLVHGSRANSLLEGQRA
jgi:rubrerythrin